VNVSSDLTGLGNAASKDALTVMIVPSATAETSTFQDFATVTSVRIDVVRAAATTITLGPPRTTILRVRTDTPPAMVTSDAGILIAHGTRAAFDAADDGYFVDSARRGVWIKLKKIPK